ncbi:nucleotidyltransferase family protein [Spirosoma fluminis]
MSIATLILAAGSSSRLGGEPKQLLHYDGQTLIRRIAQEALSLQAGPVVVVVGANRERIEAELDSLPLLITYNENWREGLAASLRTGLTAIPAEPVDAFLVLLTDQPFITADLLRQLIAVRQQTGQGIIASRYAEPGNAAQGVLGVPALFDIRYSVDFMQLSGDIGARKLIRQYPDDCAEVSFPLANIDLDTWEDVDNWRKAQGEKIQGRL